MWHAASICTSVGNMAVWTLHQPAVHGMLVMTANGSEQSEHKSCGFQVTHSENLAGTKQTFLWTYVCTHTHTHTHVYMQNKMNV